MTKTALLATAAVFALSAGPSVAQHPALSSKGFDVHATRLTIPNAGLKTLYDQNNNDGGMGVFSESESSFSSYPTQGADDFVVPSGSTWRVKEVDVTGVYYNGPGPATSENVFFYKDRGGLPGRLVGSALNVKAPDNGSGSFAIPIPAVRLKAGTYWVSVQANCPLISCGEWGWEDRSVQSNNLAAWRSPKNPPCPHWATLESCTGAGPDFMFALKGR